MIKRKMMRLLAALAVSATSWGQEPFTVKVWPTVRPKITV